MHAIPGGTPLSPSCFFTSQYRIFYTKIFTKSPKTQKTCKVNPLWNKQLPTKTISIFYHPLSFPYLLLTRSLSPPFIFLPYGKEVEGTKYVQAG